MDGGGGTAIVGADEMVIDDFLPVLVPVDGTLVDGAEDTAPVGRIDQQPCRSLGRQHLPIPKKSRPGSGGAVAAAAGGATVVALAFPLPTLCGTKAVLGPASSLACAVSTCPTRLPTALAETVVLTG